MRAILVDDERPALDFLEMQCLQVPELRVEGRFLSASTALDYLRDHPVDLVLTDIEMPGLTGLEAVRLLRELRPGVGVVFVTGYEDYAFQAFKLEAVAYLLKPCRVEDLRRAAKKAILLRPEGKRIVFRTFGPFTMLVDGLPYRFSNSKAEELLAYLVDRRGSVVTMEQAACVLWEARPYDNLVKQLYRKLTSYLNQVDREVHGGFFVANRGSCHLVPDQVDCDYFRLLAGDEDARRSYDGEYMREYSWAEETVGKLDRLAGYCGAER